MIETDIEYEVERTETSVQTVYCDGCQDPIPELDAESAGEGTAHLCEICSTAGEPLIGMKPTSVSRTMGNSAATMQLINARFASIKDMAGLMSLLGGVSGVALAIAALMRTGAAVPFSESAIAVLMICSSLVFASSAYIWVEADIDPLDRD